MVNYSDKIGLTETIRVNKPDMAVREVDMNEPSEVMSVDIELEDGSHVNCEVITILEVAGKDYIVLLPEGQTGDEQDVWFYGYSENPDDPNEEPVLSYIESDEEYEAVTDAFDEFLDECDFDE